MAKKNIKITVEGRTITISQIDDRDYISLSDMAREDGGNDRIQNWMRNRDSIEFLIAWEQIHNPQFNSVQMHRITKDLGLNRFLMSPKKWIEGTSTLSNK